MLKGRSLIRQRVVCAINWLTVNNAKFNWFYIGTDCWVHIVMSSRSLRNKSQLEMTLYFFKMYRLLGDVYYFGTCFILLCIRRYPRGDFLAIEFLMHYLAQMLECLSSCLDEFRCLCTRMEGGNCTRNSVKGSYSIVLFYCVVVLLCCCFCIMLFCCVLRQPELYKSRKPCLLTMSNEFHERHFAPRHRGVVLGNMTSRGV